MSARAAAAGAAWPRPRFTRSRSALYGAAVTLGFFGLVELILRLAGVAPMVRPTLLLYSIDAVSEFPYMQADRALFWSPRPGFQGTFHGRRIAINSLGCRGPEAPPPRAGRMRIACFGDSITFGYDVGERETYASFLGRERPDVDVLNAGVNGYTSYQVLERWRQLARATRLDVATFLVGWNDRVERPVEDRAYARRIGAVMAVEGPLDHLRLFAAAKRLYLWRARGQDQTQALVPRVGTKQYRENLETLVDECRARRVTPVFIELPHRLTASVRDLTSPYPVVLRDVAKSAGVRLVEVGPLALTAEVDNEAYFLDSLHLTPKGHAFLTRRLLALLDETGVLPG